MTPERKGVLSCTTGTQGLVPALLCILLGSFAAGQCLVMWLRTGVGAGGALRPAGEIPGNHSVQPPAGILHLLLVCLKLTVTRHGSSMQSKHGPS